MILACFWLHASRWTCDAKKKVDWQNKYFECKKKTLIWSCSWMFIFISRRTKKRVFVISDRNRDIFHTSDVYFLIISIRYDKRPLFGPAVYRNETFNYTTRSVGFFALKSVHFFLSIICVCLRVDHFDYDSIIITIVVTNLFIRDFFRSFLKDFLTILKVYCDVRRWYTVLDAVNLHHTLSVGRETASNFFNVGFRLSEKIQKRVVTGGRQKQNWEKWRGVF